jgi:hypothetical protein
VIADGEDVLVILGERRDDAILHGIEILKFVDEHGVPPRANRRALFGLLEQLGGLDDQRVEVDQPRLLRKRSYCSKSMASSCISGRRETDAPRTD